MTRINAGIPVKHLSDQHLLAEHREIKRIPNTKFTGKIPERFTLGKGHVLFFSDKNGFTFSRYSDLYSECIRRGFNVEYYGDSWSDSQGDFTPTLDDARIVLERITYRVFASSQIPRYCGKLVSKEAYVKVLGEQLMIAYNKVTN